MNRNYTHALSQDDSSLHEALQQQRGSHRGTATFARGQSDSHEVLLLIRGLVERVVVTSGLEYQFGRFDEPDGYQIDLTAYNAAERGVSRLHASIFMRDQKLYIVDKGSTNGTYVAGQRLTPNQATLLHKGSEILLGRLRIQIMFR